jgi:hypothetical protein
LGSTGETVLDGCAVSAVKRMTVGAKKAGEGKVVVRYESF